MNHTHQINQARRQAITGFVLVLFSAWALLSAIPAAQSAATLQVGFAKTDITPVVAQGKGAKLVWIAGYGKGRAATGVHDPLYARAVVLSDGKQKIALVSVDLVGLMLPTVKQVRKLLPDFDYVMVASTHNHEGPDTIGLWGPGISTGVDADYLQRVAKQCAAAVKAAEKAAVPARARYGTATDKSLLNDSRLPKVYDGVLRLLSFVTTDSKAKPIGLLVQWNCHPEAMDSKNQLITADFPYATIAALQKKYDCPVAYFSGAIGGLLAPPRDVVKDAQGKLLKRGSFQYTEKYGQMVADLAIKAVDAAGDIQLTPFAVSARSVYIPLENPLYMAARTMNVIKRDAFLSTGDPSKRGAVFKNEDMGKPGKTPTIETEVAYLRLGKLHIACIPGELYPELVYGKFQNPADPGADLPKAALEPSVMALMPGGLKSNSPDGDGKTMLFGLANDEIGYIIPKRQWDHQPPFAYGREKSQYGEMNSVGPEAAPILMQMFKRCVAEAPK